MSQTERSAQPIDPVRPSPALFWILTAAYVIAALIAVVRNWGDMLTMEPNEWADVAAGIFSPLAFLWFLYTALAQRAELRLQHLELKSNVDAQREQEQQMGRQANALDAQVARIEAQAAAQYLPIFILKSSGQASESDIRLHLHNFGAPVLEVEFEQGKIRQLMRARDGAGIVTPQGSILSHWPADHDCLVDFPSSLATEGSQDFAFHVRMKRLDAIRVHQVYRCLMAEQRLVLEQSESF